MKIGKLALTLVMLCVAPAWADEWVRCAIEDGYCRVDGTATVRFGSGYQWATQKITGGINCSRAAFGDPAPGVKKACDVLVQVRVPQNREERREDRRDDRNDNNYDVRNWEKCANESGYCKVRGTEIVKYGVGNKWATRRVTGGVGCNPGAFGSDPAVGHVKSCFIVYQDDNRRSSSNASPSWVKCASDGGTCRMDGRRRVSYGIGKQWLYATRSGSFGCNPGTFGSDPAVGQVKSCYYDSN